MEQRLFIKLQKRFFAISVIFIYLFLLSIYFSSQCAFNSSNAESLKLNEALGWKDSSLLKVFMAAHPIS